MKFVAPFLAASLLFGASGLSDRRAPGFSLPDSNFTRYDLQDYRGRWLLIDFMITNCPHCKELTKALEEAKRKFGPKIAILSVVISPPENQETVARYIKENGVTVPVLFDQGQMAASYFNATPAKPTFDTPHLFIIDPKGAIVRDFGHTEDGDHGLFEPAGLIAELEAVFKRKR